MTLTRAPAARRPYFMSPHMTQPSLASSFHPQPPTGETSLGQLTHFSITHYSVEHGEGEMGNCLPELDESSPSKMFLLLPHPPLLPIFYWWPQPYSLSHHGVNTGTPHHTVVQEQHSTGSSPMVSPTATPATS